MLEVLVQQVAPCFSRRAGNGVVTDVAVDLLRPVRGHAAEVAPEAGVLVPVLQPRLVEGEIGRRLADSGDEDRASDRRQHAVAVVEAVEESPHVGARVAGALPHRGGELVQRPGVAEADVVAGGRHPPPRLDTGLVPRIAGRGDPGGPAGDADLRECVERRPERADAPGLVGSQLRLVVRERRNGDVVLRAGGRRRCQPGGEAAPVRRRVEDGAERPALSRAQRPHVRPAHELGPESLRGGRCQRRNGLRGRAECGRRPGDRSGGDEPTGKHEQPPDQRNPLGP